MITVENVTINGKQFIKTVSDTYLIRKMGTYEIYSEAYDTPEHYYKYEETEQLLTTQNSPHYSGEYIAIPKINEDVTLETKNKFMSDNITVVAIPVSETDNSAGGQTLKIGG